MKNTNNEVKAKETIWVTDAVTNVRMTYEEFLELQASRRN